MYITREATYRAESFSKRFAHHGSPNIIISVNSVSFFASSFLRILTIHDSVRNNYCILDNTDSQMRELPYARRFTVRSVQRFLRGKKMYHKVREERLLRSCDGERRVLQRGGGGTTRGGRRLTRPTSEHRRNIDARYRSPLHFLELWSITDALSRRRGSADYHPRRRGEESG